MKKLSILFLVCSIVFAQDSIEALIQEDNASKAPMQEASQEDPLGELDQSQEQPNLDELLKDSPPPQEESEDELDELLTQPPHSENPPKQTPPKQIPQQKKQDPLKQIEPTQQSTQIAPPSVIPEASQEQQVIPQDSEVDQEKPISDQNLSSEANEINPKFFDYKYQSRENLKALTPQEVREQMHRCEETQDRKICFDTGMIFYQARSVYGQNLKYALYFFDRSCNVEMGLGCYEAGIISAKNQSYQHAFIFLEKACQSGNLRGCKNLGILYYNGQGTPKNLFKATEIFKSGCSKGDQFSCQKLYLAMGNAYQDSLNYAGAKKNFKQACTLGDLQACQKMQVIDMLEKQLYQERILKNKAIRK